MKTFSFKNIEKKDKAAIYTRVSTSKQAKEGNGLEEQLNKCKAIVTLKNWDIHKIYCNEKGISGTTEIKDREELNDLIEDGKKGLFQHLVFNSLDRLGRSTKIILEVIEIFKNLGITIVSCKELIDSSTASGELLLTFMAAICQYERQLIVQRMSAGRELVKAKYGESGGALPLGYIRGINGSVEINLEDAAIVRSIFMARENGQSLRKIATWLNNLNIKNKKGKQWYASTIKTILDNKVKYEGGERNGNENGIKWPKILFYSDEEIDKVNKLENDSCDKDDENSIENKTIFLTKE